jgi:aspartyl aminopeptidase
MAGKSESKLAYEFAEGYKDFLNKAKTEREAVAFILDRAVQAGFKNFDCSGTYKAGEKVFCVNRNKNIVLAIIGKNGVKNGARIVVSHIDSPRLDLKPHPLYESNELAMLKTNYYGGIKKYQWVALPLALHGTVALQNGEVLDITAGEFDDDFCFCITDLLPHLAREQMEKIMLKAIVGEDLNVLVGSVPLEKGKGSDLVKLGILNILNQKYGLVEEDLSFAEFEIVPSIKARDVGFDKSLIGGYGHDDRCCAYPAFMAAMSAPMPDETCVIMFVDKEETGSDGNTGMKSSFLKHFIADLSACEGVKGRHVFQKSKCISADVDSAFDPTFSCQYEPLNSAYINKGVVLTKYTGGGGKYSASDASVEFLGEIRKIFEKEKIIWQTGGMGKVDAGSGGTVAKYLANLDMDVIDLGIPVLSMHAPFEVISKLDIHEMFKALKAFIK